MTLSNCSIAPVFVAHDRKKFKIGMSNVIFQELAEIEREMAGTASSFIVEGFCIPCEKTVQFAVDITAGGRQEGELVFPNWRERLVCPHCKMSNRQRLMAALIMQQLKNASGQNVYLMEQMTPLYRWAAGHLPRQAIVGSEYLGDFYHGGETIKAWRYHESLKIGALYCTARHKASMFYSMLRIGGVRHEDVTRLSFRNGSLDVIVSNDVFEHVQDPRKAFAECARVLRPGGIMLASFPFHDSFDISVKRAESGQERLRHLLPPVYHGNPVSAESSLVFTDFGWDVIRSFQEAGFSDVAIEVYASVKFGHLGGGQLIFRMKK